MITNFSPKFVSVFVCLSAISLYGCQSSQHVSSIDTTLRADQDLIQTVNYAQTVAHNKDEHQAIFKSLNVNSDTVAKEHLVDTLSQQMKQGFVSVSQTRLLTEPYLPASDINAPIDAESNNLFYSIADWFAQELDSDSIYDDDEEDEPYRTYDDILPDDGTVFLDYLDAQRNTLPYDGYDLTWGEELSEDRIDVFESVTDGAIYQYDDCLMDYSIALDDIVEANPKATGSDEAVKAAKEAYESCVDIVQSEYPSTEKLVGYPKIYQFGQEQCMQKFEHWLDDMLNHREKTEMNYDEYNAIYESYYICTYPVWDRYTLNPVAYLEEGTSEKTLDFRVNRMQCAEDVMADFQSYAEQGITYANNPTKYTERYYEFSNCEAESYNSAFEYDDSVEYAEKDDAVLIEEATEVEVYDESSWDYVIDDEDMDDNLNTDDYENRYVTLLNEVADFFEQSPQQVNTVNHYYNRYTTIDTLREVDIANRRINFVFSYTLQAPTMYSSMQVPVAFDFNEGSIFVDTNAILPAVALLSENAPLPEQMPTEVVKFHLPESFNQELPSPVIFDALMSSIAEGYAGLDAHYFSVIDIKEDQYAQQIGADHAVKLYLGSKAAGELLGRIVKLTEQKLSQYVDENPDNFEDSSAVKSSLARWKKLNSHYQSRDVGSVFQFIEALAPFSFDMINLYYFDAKDQLLAKRERLVMGGDLLGLTNTSVTDTRYGVLSLKNHPLEKNLAYLHQAMPRALDGNEWFEQNRIQEQRFADARAARYGYEYDEYNHDDEYYDDAVIEEFGFEDAVEATDEYLLEDDFDVIDGESSDDTENDTVLLNSD